MQKIEGIDLQTALSITNKNKTKQTIKQSQSRMKSIDSILTFFIIIVIIFLFSARRIFECLTTKVYGNVGTLTT
jgi:hypothetical protein